MKVKFSNETKNDFRKYKDHHQELRKSNSDKYHHVKPKFNIGSICLRSA